MSFHEERSYKDGGVYKPIYVVLREALSRLTQGMTNSQYQTPEDPSDSWLTKTEPRVMKVERGKQGKDEPGAEGPRCTILSTSSSYQSIASEGKTGELRRISTLISRKNETDGRNSRNRVQDEDVGEKKR
jgi:hypothetical protein